MSKDRKDKDTPEPIPPMMVFLVRHWKNLLFGMAVALLGLFAVLRFTSGNETERESDYMQPPVALHELAEDPAAVADLEEILVRRGELAPKYEGILAQAHLLQQNLVEARSHANRLLSQPTQALAPYHAFAEGSLLIQEERFDEALQGARQLLTQIDSEATPLLRGHLLLRVALLSNEPGAWEDLLVALEEEPALRLFARAFRVGNTSLANFAKLKLNLS